MNDPLVRFIERPTREHLSRAYAHYRRYALGVAMRVLGDPHAARDVVHDVFLDLARAARRPPIVHYPKAFLAEAVARRACGEWRKKKRRRRSEEIAAARAAELRARKEQADLAEEHEEIAAAVGRLPPPERRCVCLIFRDGLRQRQAARVLGISTRVVQIRLRSALEKLGRWFTRRQRPGWRRSLGGRWCLLPALLSMAALLLFLLWLPASVAGQRGRASPAIVSAPDPRPGSAGAKTRSASARNSHRLRPSRGNRSARATGQPRLAPGR